MSDINKMDDYFKKSFAEYSPEVAPHIWDKIIADKEIKKPGIFWWTRIYFKNILLLTLILATVTGGVIVWKKNKKVPDSISSDKNSAIKSLTTIHKSNNSIKQATKFSKADYSSISETASGSTTTNVDQSKSINWQKSISAAIGRELLKNSGEASTHQITADAEKPVTDITNSSRVKSITYKRKGQKNIAINQSNIEEGSKQIITELLPFNQMLSRMNRLYFDAQKINSKTLLTSNTQGNLIQKIRIPECPESEKNAAGNKYYWEVYLAPDLAFKKYNDTANSVLVEKRKESIRFQSAYSAGLRYTRVFANGISLRTGINLSQINEKFSFALSNIVQNTYIIDPVSGDTTGSYTTKGTRYKTTYNHYQTIDVPLMLGYEIGNGRLHVNFNAGAMVNIFSWQQGETLDTAYQPVSFSTGKSNTAYQYKSNVGVGFSSAISFYYKLNDRLHLLAEPYYRYNFSPMNKDNFSIQEKFSTLGLRIGIRADLK